MQWISVKDRLPEKTGWYKIKTIHGEFEACMSTNMKGDLVWVIPDENVITHWQPLPAPPQPNE